MNLQIDVQIRGHLDRGKANKDDLVHHELGHHRKVLEVWHYHSTHQRTHHNGHPLYCDYSRNRRLKCPVNMSDITSAQVKVYKRHTVRKYPCPDVRTGTLVTGGGMAVTFTLLTIWESPVSG